MIPISGTTISVLRLADNAAQSDSDGSGYDEGITQTWSTVATGVRAVVGAPGGSERVVGGEQMALTCHLTCDPTDITHDDRVVDASDGELYEVVWCKSRSELGLTRVEGQLRVVKGNA
jgi:hypothetical protein